MNEKPTRRSFLGTGAAATFAGLSAVAAGRAAGGNQRLSVGIVGPGGRGTSLLRISIAGGATLTIASGIYAPHGVAIEAGGATALLTRSGYSSDGSGLGGIVRVNLPTGVVTTWAGEAITLT